MQNYQTRKLKLTLCLYKFHCERHRKEGLAPARLSWLCWLVRLYRCKKVTCACDFFPFLNVNLKRKKLGKVTYQKDWDSASHLDKQLGAAKCIARYFKNLIQYIQQFLLWRRLKSCLPFTGYSSHFLYIHLLQWSPLMLSPFRIPRMESCLLARIYLTASKCIPGAQISLELKWISLELNGPAVLSGVMPLLYNTDLLVVLTLKILIYASIPSVALLTWVRVAGLCPA